MDLAILELERRQIPHRKITKFASALDWPENVPAHCQGIATPRSWCGPILGDPYELQTPNEAVAGVPF